MNKHPRNGGVTVDRLRRSSRSKSRPALYGINTSCSPQRDNDRTSASSLVSPEPAISGRTIVKTECFPDAQGSSMSMPDHPVSSRSMVSPEAVLSAAVLAAAKQVATSKNKRKRPATTTTKQQQPQQRPTPEECEFAVLELGKLHPEVIEKCREIRDFTTVTTNVANGCKVDKDINVKTEDTELQVSACGHQPSILDGVVSTLLSQNTTAANSTRAFGYLKKAVPDWNTVPEDYEKHQQIIETAIHCGGLAQKKAANIVDLCRTLQDERGRVSLEYLRNESNADIQSDLLRHKGLGPKTISCVLLFTLGRADFPVDTHVYRITKQHHWLPPRANSRDRAYDYLNSAVPDHLKLELHCLLVQHGRECHRCAARGKPQFPPKDGSKLVCPLLRLDDIASGSHQQKSCKKIQSVAKVKTEN